MAKKKSKSLQPPLSPEKYIRSNARKLPIVECLITQEWQDAGKSILTIARKHVTGNITVGFYLLDTCCLGLKESFYFFNIPYHEYEESRDIMYAHFDYDRISYNEAHNILFGAIEYAEELGFPPNSSFGITRFILEEDTEDIPLIEYEFGHEGQPLLIVDNWQEANKYIPVLRNHVGDNFSLSILEDEMDDDGEDDFDEDEDDFLDFLSINQDLLFTTYSYCPPEYPKELHLQYEKELAPLFSPKNDLTLPKATIKRILSLPAQPLIQDLNAIILFELGRTSGEISDELWDADYVPVLTHVLFLLGELKAENSLEHILEIMRQNEDFADFHFGDISSDIIPLSLYYTGRNQLSKLLDYAKEPGLYTSLKIYVFTSVAMIARYEKERRPEVIDWFRKILRFYLDNTSDPQVFDSELIGMIMIELTGIKAHELLPEIEALYDTDLVELQCCGDFDNVAREIRSILPTSSYYSLLSIYERYEKNEKDWR